MRRFLWLVFALGTTVFPALHAAAPAPKLNVLLILADDLNCDVGCYGAEGLQTPNIDRIAARGVRFEHAYCQFPLCSPSRSSFLTGRRPNITGVLTNPNAQRPVSPHFREKIPDTITLPQLFRNNGWFAARVGKLYHYGVPLDLGTSSLDDFYSWDQVVNPRGHDRDQHDRIFTLRPGAADAFGPTLSWLADDGADAEQTDGIGATEAIRLLEKFKAESRPFFLGVGFYRPHTPYVAPKKWFDLYPANRVKLPALSADDQARTPAAAYVMGYPEEQKMTDEQRRQAIQAYHATTSFMDAQVGRVLDSLERLGFGSNTVVIFASDHGYHLGDHGLWQKRSLFERSARVPLIIAVPGARTAGRTAKAPVELLDLYPTLASLAGLPPPGYLDGLNLRPILDNPDTSIRPAAISQTLVGPNITGYSARTARWRYTEWHSADGKPAGTQLFDEESDPAESKNLAADPAQAAVVSELAALIAPVRAQR